MRMLLQQCRNTIKRFLLPKTALAAPHRPLVPKMPPGGDIVEVVDISQDSAQAMMAARALQGHINRSGAKIYVHAVQSEKDWITDTAHFGGRTVTHLPLRDEKNPGLKALLRQYQQVIKEYELYDTAKEWTFNLAMIKAGLADGLPVDAALRDDLLSTFAEKPIVDYSGIGSDRISGYTWAIEHLLPETQKEIVFLLGLRSSDWHYAPWMLYDYATACRAFLFHLDWMKPDERTLIQRILAQYAPRTPLMGYSGDCGDCFSPIASLNGLYGFAADYFPNASFWSSFPTRYGLRQERGRALQVTGGKVYVALYTSDGDNLSFNHRDLPKWLKDPAARYMPQGYSIDPILVELAPPLIEWAYQHLHSAIELTGGPSGLGYPDGGISDEQYDRWLQDNAFYMAQAGLTTAQMWNMGDCTSARVRQYLLSQPDIKGVFLDHHDGTNTYKLYKKQIAQNSSLIAAYPNDLKDRLSKVQAKPDAPTFVGYQTRADSITPTILKQLVDELHTAFPGKYVFLTPRDYLETLLMYETDKFSSTLAS